MGIIFSKEIEQNAHFPVSLGTKPVKATVLSDEKNSILSESADDTQSLEAFQKENKQLKELLKKDK